MSVRLVLLLLTVFGWPLTAAADSLRCGGSLVERGDFTAEVRETCGEPDFVDRWQANVLNPRSVIPNIEQWYYNFGPAQLIQILEFREGTLRRIESAGYGFPTPGPRDCAPTDIVEQLSKYRLLEQCGEPAQREALVVLSGRNQFGGTEFFRRDVLVPVLREYWLYNFGSNRLLRKITLENGIVVDVDTEGRGYDLDQGTSD